ncbi:MAG: hypothetical protein WDW36_003165 [Sanguina aurantia]
MLIQVGWGGPSVTSPASTAAPDPTPPAYTVLCAACSLPSDTPASDPPASKRPAGVGKQQQSANTASKSAAAADPQPATEASLARCDQPSPAAARQCLEGCSSATAACQQPAAHQRSNTVQDHSSTTVASAAAPLPLPPSGNRNSNSSPAVYTQLTQGQELPTSTPSHPIPSPCVSHTPPSHLAAAQGEAAASTSDRGKATQRGQVMEVHLLTRIDSYSPVLAVARGGGVGCGACGCTVGIKDGDYAAASKRLYLSLAATAGQSILDEPEVILVIGGEFTLDGYPPFHTRTAELQHLGPLAGLAESGFVAALRRHQHAKQRFGK